jgi:hypothetical protein
VMAARADHDLGTLVLPARGRCMDEGHFVE